MSSWPAPCALAGTFGSAAADRTSMPFTWLLLSVGRCCSRSAAAPATWGAAKEVPEPRK